MSSKVTWEFTVRDRRTGAILARLTVQARNETRLRDALVDLAAPAKVLAFLRHQGASQVRKIDWHTATRVVAGVRA